MNARRDETAENNQQGELRRRKIERREKREEGTGGERSRRGKTEVLQQRGQISGGKAPVSVEASAIRRLKV